MLVVHEEADDIALGMAAEAVEELLGLADGERGCLLVMERTARHVLLAFTLQGYTGIDDTDDIAASDQVIDEMLGDTACHRC